MSVSPVIAVTGLPGSGKSLFARELSARHGVWLNADALGHEVLKENPAREALVAAFGRGILKGEEVDRAALAQTALNEAGIRQLNAICHPLIMEKVRLQTSPKLPAGKYYVLEAALLFESEFASLADLTVLIESAFETRLSRVQSQRSWSKEELERRDALQDIQLKHQMADLVVLNDKGKETFIEKVLELDMVLRYNSSLDLKGPEFKTSVLQLLRKTNSSNISRHQH